MKKLCILTLTLCLLISSFVYGQDQNQAEKRETVIYSFFLNIVPENFHFPLFGFVNIARGNQQHVQFGFVNVCEKNLSGAQFSYVNTTGGNLHGIQAGFINTTAGNTAGPQFGFINTTAGNMSGPQFGFINTTAKAMQGIQGGYVNISAKEITGAQIGFVNTTGKLNGLQIGFINYADTIENGLPIGFLSFVRKGGYKALEISSNEMFPVNVSFKTGVPALYSSIVFSYNHGFDGKFASGLGLGSIIPINGSLFFNPEFISQTVVGTDDYLNQSVRLMPNFGYSPVKGLAITFGPSIVLNYSHKPRELLEPVFAILNNEINDKSQLIFGFSLGLRYEFSGAYKTE